MIREHAKKFNDSLDRCRDRWGFLDRFYELFMGSSPEIRAKFSATDFHRQKRVLMASLYMLMLAAEGIPEAMAPLHRLATLHDRRHRDVRPELYGRWLECLLQAVRDYDPQCTPEVEQAWQAILRPGIELMMSAY